MLQPESSYLYEFPVAPWAASTTGYRTAGDLIWPEESGSIILCGSHSFVASQYSLCFFSPIQSAVRGLCGAFQRCDGHRKVSEYLSINDGVFNQWWYRKEAQYTWSILLPNTTHKIKCLLFADVDLFVSSKRVAAGGVLWSQKKDPDAARIRHPTESGHMKSVVRGGSYFTRRLCFTAQTEKKRKNWEWRCRMWNRWFVRAGLNPGDPIIVYACISFSTEI